jgi:hypothetical protein
MASCSSHYAVARAGRARTCAGHGSTREVDDDFAATTAARLGLVVCGRLEDLLSRLSVLAELKSDPEPLRLDTLLAEIGTLPILSPGFGHVGYERGDPRFEGRDGCGRVG